MPERITIDKLRIDDSKHPKNYRGAAIFANFNRNFNDDSYVEKYSYIKTKEVILKNVTTTSGKPLRISDNPFMFRDVKVQTLLAQIAADEGYDFILDAADNNILYADPEHDLTQDIVDLLNSEEVGD